jgi:hypothetical protein
MATEPQSTGLPIFYGSLEPLSSSVHAGFSSRSSDRAPFLTKNHAIPITIDEFVAVQRHYPIVFSVGDNPVPLALMGLNEGVNVFVDETGKPAGDIYLPAYVRRYPFMLARLQPEAQELSLCFDPTSGLVGDFEDGEPLFAEGKLSETTTNILKFCEEFELSAQRTVAFMTELKDAGLLMDGEVSIQPAGVEQPFVYRGFQMVNEERMRALEGDDLKRMNGNGMLPLILAHLFSVSLVRDIFAKQMQQGKGPSIPGMGAPVGNA